ncbi:hypothetical protein ACFQY7_16435 [Actinomadura luteofluorescens]|uniref:Uncharacterized protein n=1 Tax=Actinomadura luteofluorescens TaxID=46163 RepID=A0A7Y9JLY0_9ACTN|nr:hypothetical protein [Actinomadura luteofluorescens]NYD51984.1 hypothetical protein [Actinomadura luteofluorescens]
MLAAADGRHGGVVGASQYLVGPTDPQKVSVQPFSEAMPSREEGLRPGIGGGLVQVFQIGFRKPPTVFECFEQRACQAVLGRAHQNVDSPGLAVGVARDPPLIVALDERFSAEVMRGEVLSLLRDAADELHAQLL